MQSVYCTPPCNLPLEESAERSCSKTILMKIKLVVRTTKDDGRFTIE